MNKQIIVILIAFTFLGCKNFQIRNKKYLEKLIVGKGNSNWDPYWNNSDTIGGLGLHIIDKNNLVLYIYKNKIRTKYDYGGDIILDTLPWNLNADTLFISGYYKFKILSIKNNELKMEDCEHHLKAVFIKKDNLPLQ